MPESPLRDVLRLMLVADSRLLGGSDLAETCAAAERGGATSILVRLHDATSRDLAASVRAVRSRVTIPVLVNDRADVAIACGAAGVHLGPDDVPVPLVRRIAPRSFIIGASVATAEEVEAGRGADYWRVGPWRVTGGEAVPMVELGPAGFAAIVRRAEGRPCLAAGGVRPEDIPGVLEVGGVGVAVGSGILGQADIRARALAYRREFAAIGRAGSG